MADSHRTDERTWARLIPTARSRPSSRRRSWIDRASVLAMPSRAITTARPSRAYISTRMVSMAPFCWVMNPSVVSTLAVG